jgi:hypothetical protein
MPPEIEALSNTPNTPATPEDTATTTTTPVEGDDDLVKRLVREQVDKELLDIKKKLDTSYRQRDEALAKVAEIDREKREANLKRLEEEGKHKEAFELRLATLEAEKRELEKRNTELSRDVSVRDALKSFNWRNDRSAAMGFNDIVSQLVQNEAGQWVHKSGASVKDFVEAFAKDDDNSFLFKPKSSSGAGTTQPGISIPTTERNKSLFAMSQAEVIKLAEQGKL